MTAKDNTTEPIRKFNSLTDIRAYKEELKQEIVQDESEIAQLWNTLFHPEQPETTTRGQRLMRVLNVGTSMFDGALLAWKVYKKFGGSKTFSLFGKHKH